MPLPDAPPASMERNEIPASRVYGKEASLFAVLRDEILEAHEARCDRIAHRVMIRVAGLPLPAAGK